MRGQGLLKSFLSMCPNLGRYGTSEIPRNMWEFFQSLYFPKYLIPQPFLSSLLVCLLFAPAVIPCSRAAAGTNAFAFICFQQMLHPPQPPPVQLCQCWESSKLTQIKARPLSWSFREPTRQVKINKHNSLRIRAIPLPLVVGTYTQNADFCLQGCH